MILPALIEAITRDELLLVEGGMCRYHRRRDGLVVIREILVLPECRGRGIGRGLVERIMGRHTSSPILARCPVDYPSNGFWSRLGFARTGTENNGKLNLWQIGRLD